MGARGRKGELFKNRTGVIPRPNSMLQTQRVCLLQACVWVSMFHYVSFKLDGCFHPAVCHGVCTAVVSSRGFCAGKARTHWPGDKVSRASLSRCAPGATGTGRSGAIGFIRRAGRIGSCFQAPACCKTTMWGWGHICRHRMF